MAVFEISGWNTNGSHRVVFAGELDIAHAEAAHDHLVRVSGSTVVLDLAALTFIDAAGLSAIAAAQRSMAFQGDRLVIINATDHVRRVFDLGGLAHLLGAAP